MTKLHIISFDVPFPPNYGGVIDVFYKIKALHKLGVKIILHTFDYGRGKPTELNNYCDDIFYYERGSILNFFSRKPFIVKSRKSNKLIKTLKKDNHPILFEGIHTTHPLINSDFNNRIILVRTHNIEHDYYVGLAKSEKNIYKKIFFNIESKKLKYYEKIIQKVSYILTISPSEHQYFTNKFGEKCVYTPVFHKEEKVIPLSHKGEFALYHGDLRVSDNTKSVSYLIDIFKKIKYPLLIASSFPNKKITESIKNYSNIKYISLDYKKKNQLEDLFNKAHINVLPTFQATGIKLKLIHALFSSRFCIVTPEMVKNTGLEPLCKIGSSKKDFTNKILETIKQEYTQDEINKKAEKLKSFNTLENAKKITALLLR
jgi:hypothetical protein